MGLLRSLGIQGKEGKNNHIFIWLIFTVLAAMLPIIISWFTWYVVCDKENKSYYGIKDVAFFALVINIANFYELMNKGLKLNTDLMQKVFFFTGSIILIIFLCLMVGILFYVEYRDQGQPGPLYIARVWALIIAGCSTMLSFNITCAYKEVFK